MILQLIGPMTGVKDYNFPLFYAAAAALRMKGHQVFSPAEMDIENFEAFWDTATKSIKLCNSFSCEKAMQRDIACLLSIAECNDARNKAVVCLPGIENSKHGQIELIVAQAIGLKVFDYLGEGEIRERES